MMYYTSSHLPESGGQLLITSLTHNKKIVASSSTDIVLQCNLTEHISLAGILSLHSYKYTI